MPFLEIATELLNRGYSVIPIEPRGKRPIGGFGATSRTRDLAVVKGWAVKYPDANVGIVADENIVILETDDYEAFSEAVKNGTGKEVPTTARAFGSSPNRPHFFFKRTVAASNVGNLAVPGLFEARFSNQYVVGAGSIHPSGAIYRWANNERLEGIPDWLVSELARLALQQKERTSLRAIERVNGRVTEGSRHYFLMSELGRLWNGKISEDELVEEGRRLNGYCDPPKPDAHVLECVRDVMRRDPFDPGPKVKLGSSEVKPKPGDNFRYPGRPGRTRDYVLQPTEGHKFNGWFPRGRVSIIGGSSGAGKTTFILDLLACQRDGRVYLGHAGNRLDFLVLFADRTKLSNIETLERMGLEHRRLPIDYMPICWDGGAVNAILDRIEDCGENMPAAVFVEGADALVSDANKTQVVAPFLSGLQKIAEHYHIALILSVGAPKSKPKDTYVNKRFQIFGSQMWSRMAEDILTLNEVGDGTEDERRLSVQHRNARAEKFELVFKDGLLAEKPAATQLEGVAQTREVLSKDDRASQLIDDLRKLEPETVLDADDFSYLPGESFYRHLRSLAEHKLDGWVGKKDGRWVRGHKA